MELEQNLDTMDLADGFLRSTMKRVEFFWAGNDPLCEVDGENVTEYAVDGFWPHLIWNNGIAYHAIVSHLGVIREFLDDSGEVAW